MRYRSTFYYQGKRYEATGKDQREADKKAALKLDKLKRGEVGLNPNMTVARWAEEWLEVYKRPAIGDGQYKNYLAHINGVIIPAVGRIALSQVKDIHLQKILNDRAGKSKSDLSRLRATLKAMFKQAVISRLIPHSPADNLVLPAATDGKRRSITDLERKYILKLAETHHAGMWIKTLLYCGLRPGETRALDWRHIDTDRAMLRVERAMKASSKEIGPPKSASGVRDIPIPNVLLPDFIKAYGNPFEPVFTQPTTGKRHTKQSMTSLWNGFKRELDISMGAKLYRNKITVSVVSPDLVPYCLRHTYCTDLQDAGIPINVARYLMGHADISMTAKIYTHTTDKTIAEAASRINAFNMVESMVEQLP